MKTGGSSSPSSVGSWSSERVGLEMREVFFEVRLLKVGIGVSSVPGVDIEGDGEDLGLGDEVLIDGVDDSGSESDSGRPIFRGLARRIDILPTL